MQQLTIPKPLIKILEAKFEEAWKKELLGDVQRKKYRQSQIKQIKAKQKKLEHSIVNTTNVRLQEKLEKDRALLDEQIHELENHMEHDTLPQIKLKSIMAKTRQLLEDPYALWTLGDAHMKQLLLGVRF